MIQQMEQQLQEANEKLSSMESMRLNSQRSMPARNNRYSNNDMFFSFKNNDFEVKAQTIMSQLQLKQTAVFNHGSEEKDFANKKSSSKEKSNTDRGKLSSRHIASV